MKSGSSQRKAPAALEIELPPKLLPVFDGTARFRGAYGGRGSAKTRSFAKMVCIRGAMFALAGVCGVVLCAREYMNSLDDSSIAEVKAAIASEPWLQAVYEVGETFVRTKDRRVELVFAGLRHNLASLKSKARILLCWVDEAEPVTEVAWQILIPTVREAGSEIWVTWNPGKRGSATDKRFRGSTDADVKIVEMNWRDNPWFPEVLEVERQRDLRDRPEQYDHIWEGGYVTALAGAYYAKALAKAKEDGRLTRLAVDPLLTVRIYCDIGGAGAKSDAFTMWPTQWVSKEIRYLDYYEASGQEIGHHLAWLRKRGYEPGTTRIVLPHDGDNSDKVFHVSYRSAFEAAGYKVDVVPNMGRGAATARIEAARRWFSRMWFDKERCSAGLDAIGWYHEKIDNDRNIGLGPDHDWSSHGADAFGLSAVDYTEPTSNGSFNRDIEYGSNGVY